MARLRSCSKCGRVHEVTYKCGAGTPRAKKSSAGDLRNTYRWRKMRDYIKVRDFNYCQVCFKETYPHPDRRLAFKDVQVHHIVPYKENEDLFLNSDNLITLCKYHHEMAEAGAIPRDHLSKLALERNIY